MRQRLRPDAEIAFDGEASLCPLMDHLPFSIGYCGIEGRLISLGHPITDHRSRGLADVLASHVVDVHYGVLIARAVAHQDHWPLPRVFELIERSACNQRRHAGRQRGQTAIWEA